MDQEFQRGLSQKLEKELPGIKAQLTRLAGLSSPRGDKKKRFAFEVQLDVVALWAEDGSLRAMSSLKTRGNLVMPNRSNVNPPSFVCSLAKPIHTAHALSEAVITPTTLIRATDCVAPNGFRFDGPADDSLLPFSSHLIASRNAPFICLANRLGIENVLAKWREVFPGCKLPGGQGFTADPYQIMRGLNRPEADLTPTAIAEAYTALARRGQQRSLRVIEWMYARDKKIALVAPPGRQVFKEEAAVLTASLLRAGTKGLSHWKPTEGFDLALKTGSSSNTYWTVLFSPRLVVVVRYLIVPAEELVDERAASKFSREVERRFEAVFAGTVVKPFADSVLAVIKERRRGWLRGTFTHDALVRLQIAPARECVTNDGSGVMVEYIRGTEPAPCPSEEVSEEVVDP